MGLKLARALVRQKCIAEAVDVLRIALEQEMDFSGSELGPWMLDGELKELYARLLYPRPPLSPPRAWEWPDKQTHIAGVHTKRGHLTWWWGRHLSQQGEPANCMTQDLHQFVAYGPCGTPPLCVLREMTELLDCTDAPWLLHALKRAQ